MNRQAAILSRSVLLAATLLAAFLFAAGSRAQTTVTPIQNVSRDADNSVQPKIAQAPDGSVHAVWRQEPGVIKYAKGVWTGTQYSFGSSTILADTGNFGYATPTIAVAPNSTVMAAWTEPGANGELIKVQTWDGRASQPSGSARAVSAGRETVIAADSASQFHIVSNSNFQIKYCQWDGGAGCAKSDTFSAPDATGNNQPDIAVDSADVVHVVWMRNGNGIFTRTRASGANWGPIVELGSGTWAEIAADRQGDVHVVWSNNYDIEYCRKTASSGCTAKHMISRGNDVRPSVGVDPAGTILVAFREETGRRIAYATNTGGQWSVPADIAEGPTDPDVTARPYNNRASITWSHDYEIQHVVISVTPPTPPTPTPVPPTPTPVPPKFTGSLVVNDGAEVTTNPQVNVTINNTSAEVPSSYSLADDVEPGMPSTPFTNASTTTSFTLDVADGRCRIHKVNAKLGSSTSTSETFSDSILFDPSADALIIARNPNLPTNPEINQFFSASLPSGDVAFTRRKDFNTSISRGPNECSNLTRYAFVKQGKALTDADWRNMPAEGYVSAYTTFTPDLPGAEGAYQFEGYVEDSVGHKTTNPYIVTIVYDVTGPTVSGASGALTTTPSPKGGIAEIDTSGLAINDNLYTDPSNTRKYWGYWIVVKKTDAGAPTENEWAQFGFVKGGLMPSPLGWNISRGIVGGINNFTAGQHTIYIRYLDGAGNWSNTVNSHPVQVNQLELLTRLPMLSR